jgi:hypothetical protein
MESMHISTPKVMVKNAKKDRNSYIKTRVLLNREEVTYEYAAAEAFHLKTSSVLH